MEMMNGMLPLLDDISRKHHDPSVKEMTSDLRIAIATRGTVWSENLKTAKENLGEKKVRMIEKKMYSICTCILISGYICRLHFLPFCFCLYCWSILEQIQDVCGEHLLKETFKEIRVISRWTK